MKKSTFFQGLFIALFVLISQGLTAQCQLTWSCPATCPCCICFQEIDYLDRWDPDPCSNCPHEILVTDHQIYLVIPEGRAEAFLTRTITNTRNVVFTRITDVYNNRVLNERFAELERSHQSRSANSTGQFDLLKNSTENFLLSQNAPNPFSAITSIDYALPAGTLRGQLTLYDSKGQVVKQWELEDAGTINLNPDGLVSGNYFYCLSADGVDLATKKMILL